MRSLYKPSNSLTESLLENPSVEMAASLFDEEKSEAIIDIDTEKLKNQATQEKIGISPFNKEMQLLEDCIAILSQSKKNKYQTVSWSVRILMLLILIPGIVFLIRDILQANDKYDNEYHDYTIEKTHMDYTQALLVNASHQIYSGGRACDDLFKWTDYYCNSKLSGRTSDIGVWCGSSPPYPKFNTVCCPIFLDFCSNLNKYPKAPNYPTDIVSGLGLGIALLTVTILIEVASTLLTDFKKKDSEPRHFFITVKLLDYLHYAIPIKQFEYLTQDELLIIKKGIKKFSVYKALYTKNIAELLTLFNQVYKEKYLAANEIRNACPDFPGEISGLINEYSREVTIEDVFNQLPQYVKQEIPNALANEFTTEKNAQEKLEFFQNLHVMLTYHYTRNSQIPEDWWVNNIKSPVTELLKKEFENFSIEDEKLSAIISNGRMVNVKREIIEFIKKNLTDSFRAMHVDIHEFITSIATAKKDKDIENLINKYEEAATKIIFKEFPEIATHILPKYREDGSYVRLTVLLNERQVSKAIDKMGIFANRDSIALAKEKPALQMLKDSNAFARFKIA